MTNTDLAELISRLEAASEGSRELDILIARAVGGTLVDGRFERSASWGNVVQATTSLDAITALTEEKLPGWRKSLEEYWRHDDPEQGRGGWEVSLFEPARAVNVYAAHADECLARCIALLKAIQAQETKG